MELKLESSLRHQLLPVNAVATVVEASVVQKAQENHQNPLLAKRLDANALQRVRKETDILEKATKKRIREQNLPEKIKSLPQHIHLLVPYTLRIQNQTVLEDVLPQHQVFLARCL